MWTRADLKTRAKAVLKNNYWRALIVSIVVLVSGAGYSFNSTTSWRESNGGYLGYYANKLFSGASELIDGAKNTINRVSRMSGDEISTYVYRTTQRGGVSRAWNYITSGINPIALIIGFGLLMAGIFVMFFRIFAGYGLEVGSRRYFINAADNPQTDFNALGIAFREGHYFNTLLTMLMRSLYTFLWTLLFIIPGIIKSFSYSMVPYILADNPNIQSSRALELSQKLTYGHKWEMFVLDLSFIGWYLLGSICFGIGVVLVFPYENTTKAELYLTLRNNALDSGVASCEELCLVPVSARDDYIDMTDDRKN